MSKSLGEQHYVGLFEDEKSIRDKIKRAVTDSGSEVTYDPVKKPAISNLLAIYSGISGKSIKELEKEFRGANYSSFKASLADAVVEHLRPIQARYQELSQNPVKVQSIFYTGAQKAKIESQKVMGKVREKVGLK